MTAETISTLGAVVAILVARFGMFTWSHRSTERQVERLRTEMTAGFARMDSRFDQIDARFTRVEARLGRLEDDTTDVKVAIARLEGPAPRLIRASR